MTTPYPQKDNEFIAWYPLGLTKESSGHVWRPKRAGYYVHIPFCTAICDYCGFAVEKLKGAGVERYVEALKTEIRAYARQNRLSGYEFVCGHFGGGTPSAIPAAQLASVKELIDESFDVKPDAEVTVEVNPITFTLEKARTYKSAGVNRISFGVQSFNDRTLATIGRPHRSRDVDETLAILHEIGWENFSIDLMYGVPGQTLEELRDDLQMAAASGAAHISCFRLEIIPLTVLKLRESAGLLPSRLPEEQLNEMDELVASVLTDAGYRSYGAFNFARPGFESIHNEVAFMAPQAEYVGFGNSSYSFINGFIYCNYADIGDYEEAVYSGRDPIALAAPVNALEAMSRYFVLGIKFFRVSRTAFKERFGMDPEACFPAELSRLSDGGLLIIEGDDYVLTPLGRKYVNNVAKEFYVGNNRGMSQFPQFVSNLTVEQITRYYEIRSKAQECPSG